MSASSPPTWTGPSGILPPRRAGLYSPPLRLCIALGLASIAYLVEFTPVLRVTRVRRMRTSVLRVQSRSFHILPRALPVAVAVTSAVQVEGGRLRPGCQLRPAQSLPAPDSVPYCRIISMRTVSYVYLPISAPHGQLPTTTSS